MTTATAQASPNIAFIKYRLAKLGRTNGMCGIGAGESTYRKINEILAEPVRPGS
jgi:hypothetical protein